MTSIEEEYEERHMYRYLPVDTHFARVQEKSGTYCVSELEASLMDRLFTVAVSLGERGMDQFFVMCALYNTCHIYNQYIGHPRNTTMEYDSDEDILAYVSSLFLALSMWCYDDRVDESIGDILRVLPSRYIKLTLCDVKEEAIVVFSRLRGDIMTPNLDRRAFDWDDTRRSIYSVFMILVMCYTDLESLRPSLLRKAMSALVDSLFVPGYGNVIGPSATVGREVSVVYWLIVCHIARLSKFVVDSLYHEKHTPGTRVKSLLEECILEIARMASDVPIRVEAPVVVAAARQRMQKNNHHQHNKNHNIVNDHFYVIGETLSKKRYVTVQRVRPHIEASSNNPTVDAATTTTTVEYIVKKFATRKAPETTTTTTTMTKDDDYARSELTHFQLIAREIALMVYLCSEKIMPVLALRHDKAYFHLFMNADGINLSEYIQALTESTGSPDLNGSGERIYRIVSDICHAVAYCHRHDIVHHDIKPCNFVISPSDGTVRLIDFGLSEPHFSHHQSHCLIVQPLIYRAPELLLANTHYTEAVDLWAMGCVIYQVASLQNEHAISIDDVDMPSDAQLLDEARFRNRLLMLQIISCRLSRGNPGIFNSVSMVEHAVLGSYPLWKTVKSSESKAKPLTGAYKCINFDEEIVDKTIRSIVVSLFSVVPAHRISAKDASALLLANHYRQDY